MSQLTQLDWTTLQHIAEFIGFILASLITAFVQARRNDKQIAKTDRDEDDTIRQETLSSFSTLMANYKERIAEQAQELDAAKESHNNERAVMVKAIYALVDGGAILDAANEYALRNIGVELQNRHQQTTQHIEKARKLTDDMTQDIENAESEASP